MVGEHETLKVGRYALGERIAAGGMATVHLGRLVGSAGFARMVAIKRLHPQFCEDPAFTAGFTDEARLAARIRHPNVVPTLDVVSTDGELLIVMEYVDGEALSALTKKTAGLMPLPIVSAIVSEMLHGLHAAHEAKSETGVPLEIVHRDVSPQNVLVGADGIARLVDFGIARTTSGQRQASTGENVLKGKLAYMAPEQIRRDDVTRRTDIFAAGIVLWELLTGQRLFLSEHELATVEKIMIGHVPVPSSIAPGIPAALDDLVLRALDPEPAKRFDTAREMAIALEDAVTRALGREVGAFVEATAGAALAKRRELVIRAEQGTSAPADPIARGDVATVDMPTTPRRLEAPAWSEDTKTAFVETTPSHVLALRPERLPYYAAAVGIALFVVGLGSWKQLNSHVDVAPARATQAIVAPLPPAALPAPTVTEPPPEPAVTTPVSTPTPAPKRGPIRSYRPTTPKCVSKLDPTTGRRTYQGSCE